MRRSRTHVSAVSVNIVQEKDVLRFVVERVRNGDPAQIVTVNAEFVVQAQGDREFARVIARADLATPDGSGVLWALARQGMIVEKRAGGSDLIWALSDQARRMGHRLFLLGGAPGVAERAGATLSRAYPGLTIAGTHSGSPSECEERAIVDLIRRSEADILFVAFGAPAQDLWIARNLWGTGVRVAMGVGGSFDYLAGTARRAPPWMRDRGVEWVWRLVRQPWRLRRMLALPRFVWLVLRSGTGGVVIPRRER